jgi:rhodanese-related sulfurtransferase
MALCVLLDIQPSPLGQLMTLNLSDFSTGGFRFDGALEPDAADALRFIAPHQITATDRVIELRPEAEAQAPVVPRAERHLVPDMSHITLTPPTTRTVLTCRSGLRAWQAARALQARGQADLALIAMSDAPSLPVDP